MNALFAIQSVTLWLLPIGVILLAFAFISQHWIESFSLATDRAIFWLAGALLTIGVVGFVAPYVVIFFGAHPV